MANIKIDGGLCKNCGLCIEACFYRNFSQNGSAVSVVESITGCSSCGHCVAVCPTHAITHDGVGECESRTDWPLPDYERFLNLVRIRRSRREFTGRPVSREELDKLVTAAAQAPTAMNSREVYLTLITSRSVIESLCGRAIAGIRKLIGLLHSPVSRIMVRMAAGPSYGQLLGYLPQFEQLVRDYEAGTDVVVYGAPCVALFHTPKSDTLGAENAVYSAAQFMLAAETLGLGTCIIGFITETAVRDAELRRVAALPDDHRVQTTIAVGHPKFSYSRPVPLRETNVTFISE